jgi:hypothetical protein
MAAAVLKIVKNPDAARVMGRQAMDELYMSWEDAVGKACQRYPDVIKEYRQTSGERIDIQDKKLFKLAEDVNKAFEKLKRYKEWQKPLKKTVWKSRSVIRTQTRKCNKEP